MMAKITTPLPNHLEFAKLVDELENKSDTELVILSMAYLDQALEFAIKTELNTTDNEVIGGLFDYFRGSLRELGSKLNIAAGMGLISSEIWNDLKAASGLRNFYAHRLVQPSWSDPDVETKLNKLVITAEDRTTHDAFLPEDMSREEQDLDQTMSTPAGGTIDTSIHDVIADGNGYVAFYCRKVASDHVTEPNKRRYLESYWTCLFLIMARAALPWADQNSTL